jgi:predicted  nucleic acid-binding Zn-ribbon protein
MTIKKYLKIMAEYFDEDQYKSSNKKKSIKLILKKLKKREKSLKEKLGEESSKSKKKSIEREIQIAHAQRNKGLKALKELNKK